MFARLSRGLFLNIEYNEEKLADVIVDTVQAAVSIVPFQLLQISCNGARLIPVVWV